MSTTPTTHRLFGWLRSERGAISANSLFVIGAVVLVLAWSHGALAPVSGVVPGTPAYENEPGNDFINGFKDGYSQARNNGQSDTPREVAAP